MSMSVIALIIIAMAIAAVAYRAQRPKTMQRREALSSVRAEEESDYWRGMYRREEEAFAAYSRKAAALRQDASEDARIHAVDKDIQLTLRYWSTCLIFEDVDEFAPTRAELDRLFDRRCRILAGE